MGVALKLFSHRSTPQTMQDPHALLQDYLDRACLPMVGSVDWERRERFRDEVLGHLEGLMDDFMEEGLSRYEAALKAMDVHGQPGKIGAEVFDTLYEKASKGPLEKRFGRANCLATSAFIILQGAYFALLQLRVFMPSGAIYQLPFAPAQVRKVWPDPLPYPELSATFILLVVAPILIPIIGGWVVGLNVPVRAASATYRALVPLTFCTLLVGAMLLPMVEGVLFGLFQLVFWLPVGCLTAYVSSILVRTHRAGRMTCKGAGSSRARYEKQ